MPADTYDESSVRSIVSINFLFPKATRAETRIKKAGFIFETSYFTEDDKENPIGRSIGRRYNDIFVETLYYAGKDIHKTDIIGRSVSRQYEETYTEVNYFDHRNNEKKHVWTGQVWQLKTCYKTNYYAAEDTQRENLLGTSTTSKNTPTYTSTYEFQPTNEKDEQKDKQKNASIEMTTISKNPQTTFAQPKAAPKQPATDSENKNNKGKCCSIL